MKADFRESGREDVVEKVVADLGGRADAATVRAKLSECLAIAKDQLLNES